MNIQTRTGRILDDLTKTTRRGVIGLAAPRNDNKAAAEALFKPSSAILRDADLARYEATKTLVDFVAWLGGMLDVGSGLPPDEMVTKVVTITPEVAAYILDKHNTNNRSLKQGKIKRFISIIQNGLWHVTSQGMSFSRNNILNNGQNRLHAIALAGTPVKVALTFGEERSAFAVLDSEMTVRGTADTAHILGYKNTTTLAAAARLINSIENDTGGASIPNSQIGLIIGSHPGLEDATTLGQRLAGKLRAPSSGMTAAVYYICRDSAKKERIEHFVEMLCNPDGLRQGDPILWLRDGFKDRQLDVGLRSNFMRSVAQAAAVINAWNLWVNGKSGKRGMLPKIIWTPADSFPAAE